MIVKKIQSSWRRRTWKRSRSRKQCGRPVDRPQQRRNAAQIFDR